MKLKKHDSFTKDIVSKLHVRKARLSPDMKVLLSGKLSILEREKLMEKLEITKPELDALRAEREVSNADILEVLRVEGVPKVVIDYIAARLDKKHYVDIAKRTNDKLDAFVAVSKAISLAEKELAEDGKADKTIELSSAIALAAKNSGIPRQTLDRHLKQSIRKE